MNEDGEFRCDHEFAETTPPCCSGRDCGCYGLWSVYCDDCDYMNMPEDEMNALLEAGEPDPDIEYERSKDYELSLSGA